MCPVLVACTRSACRVKREPHPHGVAQDRTKEDKRMWSKYATMVGLAVALLGLAATLASAVELTYSEVQESLRPNWLRVLEIA